MAVLLVTYDLSEPEENQKKLLDVLKQRYTPVKLSDTAYAVTTTDSPERVYDRLVPYLKREDRVCVVTLSAPFYAFGSKEVKSLLDNHLA